MDHLSKPEQALTAQQLATQLNVAFKKSGLTAARFYDILWFRPSVEYTVFYKDYICLDVWVKGWMFRFENYPESKDSSWLCEPCPDYHMGI